MGHIITDLKETFRRGNTFIRLIYINVGIFVIGTLISVILHQPLSLLQKEFLL